VKVSIATHDIVGAPLREPAFRDYAIPEDLYTDPGWEIVGFVPMTFGGEPLRGYDGNLNGSNGAIGSSVWGVFARLKKEPK
jgi:hypothetical protein